MYLDFFGFKEKPFSITPDVNYLYLGKQYEQAIETLLYGIKQRNGFLMLSGEVGTGKTLISRALLTRLDSSVATALVLNPLLSVPELLKSITKDFGISIRYVSPQKQIEALNAFLIKLSEENRNAVVLIDEAQSLSIEAMEAIRLLTNLETRNTKLLQILLIGQPELVKKLKSHELRQLDQRITTRFHLLALTQSEMMRYINHRIYVAGGGASLFFDPKCCKAIYKHTKGYPRLINILCDKALLAAFVRGTKTIDTICVRMAVDDWKGKEKTSPWGFLKRLVFSS